MQVETEPIKLDQLNYKKNPTTTTPSTNIANNLIQEKMLLFQK